MSRSDPLTVRSYDSDTATMSDTESRAGVERLDVLLAERDALVDKLATLRPLFGPLGLFGHRRKIELSRLTVALVAEATKDGGKKPTDTVLDAMAHDHPDYVSMIEHAVTAAAEWVRAEEALEAITLRINRGQSLLRYLASEPKA